MGMGISLQELAAIAAARTIVVQVDAHTVVIVTTWNVSVCRVCEKWTVCGVR